MPLLRPSPSDFTAVVKALANAGAAVTNPQGSRPPSKGGVAFVNAAAVSSVITGSPFKSVQPNVQPKRAAVAPAPAAVTISLANAGGNSGTYDGFVVKYNSEGTPQWARRVGGTGGDFVNSVSIDSSGNIIVAGIYNSTLTIYNADGTTFTTLANAGSYDGFVVKYNSEGTPLWVRRLSGTGDDRIRSVSTDSSGNIIISGQYASTTLTIYNADGTTFTTLANAGNADSFVVKYNSEGTPQWVRRLGATGDDGVVSVDTDSSGNIIVAGQYATTTLTIYNGDGTTAFELTNAGSYDVFVVKYNSEGTPQWARRVGGTGGEFGNLVSTDSSGNIIVAASTDSTTLTIYNGDGTTFTTLANIGSYDGFIVKYNSEGTPQWARRVGGTGSDSANSVSTDSSGNIIVATSYSSTTLTIYNADGTTFTTLANAGTGNADSFVVKYNSEGTPQWARRVGGTGGDVAISVSADSSGSIVVSGYYASTTLTIYNADGTTFTTLSNAGGSDGFVVKYNSEGTIQLVRRLGGMDSESAYSVRIDSNGNIIVAGYYESNPILFLSTNNIPVLPSTFIQLSNSGSTDVYVVKYNSSATFQWAARVSGIYGDTLSMLKLDSSENVYLLGLYQSTTLTIYNANGTAFGTTLANLGNKDHFIAKYNSSGVVQWVARLGGTGDDSTTPISLIDSNGNIVIMGKINSSTLTFYNADGTAFGTTLSPAGSNEGYIAKYNSSGVVQWANRIKADYVTFASGPVIDTAGNSFIYGEMSHNPLTNTMVLDNANGTTTTLANLYAGVRQSYIVKYNSSGNVAWAICQGRSTFTVLDFIRSIATDSDNNVIIGGQYNDSSGHIIRNADGTAFGTTMTQNAGGWGNTYIAKYNSSGTVQWASRIDGNHDDNIFSVKTDSNGNVFTIGTFRSTTITVYNADGTAFGTTLTNTGTNSTTDIFIVKYNSSGVVQWVASIGSSGTDDINQYIIQPDSDGNLILSGPLSSSSLKIYDTNGTTFKTLTVVGGSDIFVVKYGSSAIDWVVICSGSNSELIERLITDSAGNVIIGGYSNSGTLTLYNANGITNTTLSLSGQSGFIAKYNSSGVFQWGKGIGQRSSPTDTVSRIEFDSSGNLLIGGTYSVGTLKIDL